MEMNQEIKEEIGKLSRQEFWTELEKLKGEETDLADEYLYIRFETDFEGFCDYFFPHYTGYPWNQFHKDCFTFYSTDQADARRVDCAPRGYAKSTIKALFKPIHDICYRKEKYLLFISATKSQAVGKLTDIRAELLSNDGLLDIYDLSFGTKKPGSEKFIITSGDIEIYLHAIGAGTEIRGARFRETRPSKIILDDVEDSEEVHNEEIREKVKAWFYEDISNLGSERTNIEIVGTVLHKKSLLMELSRNPAYISHIYKAVLSWADNQKLWDQWRLIYIDIDNEHRATDAHKFFMQNELPMLKGTEVLWPEKEPYEVLMREMVEKGKRAFMKEKQNAPLPSTEALFETIWWYHVDERRNGIIIEKTGTFIPMEDLRAYGAIDPAIGDSKKKKNPKLDCTCIVSGYHDSKGRLFVHQDWTKRERPTRYIQEIFTHHEMMDYEKFVVETNLFRGLLLENLIRERKKREAERKKRGDKNWGIKVPFYEIDNREKKEKRIFTLEPKVNYGWILFNRTLSMEFIDQIEQFPAADHDDAPDALEMLWSLVNNRYQPSALNLDAMGSK